MQRKRSIWITGLFLVAVMLGICGMWQFHLLRELRVYVEKDSTGLLSFKANETIPSVYTVTQGANRNIPPDQLMVEVSLFGLIPLRQMVVDVIPQVRLIPGGHSIGVTLNSQGVMVVGFAPLYGEDGKSNPAREAGVLVGDTVLAINGKKVENEHEMGALIEKMGSGGEAIQFEVKRKGQIKKFAVIPKYCSDSASYRVGLYVRDSAAGVGTLTFVDPKTGRFGALGHVITDADTNQPINVRKGRIIRAGVQKIRKGQKGLPGEKVGVFVEDGKFAGRITRNTQVGIFGTAPEGMTNPFYPEPLPVAASNQIQTGNAEILTVIKGEI
ncbi:MAG TPA: SpoIVB peptidase, partial [Bacillota bacterium]|nr:SpoIVB peptidase [Bacillota bacterium]